LSEPLAERFMNRVPQFAYKLELDDKDKILWRATIDGKEVVETSEPLASTGRKFSAWFQKVAPEGQL
jgi:hypothetical protein